MAPPTDDDHDCGWRAYAKAQEAKLAELTEKLAALERRLQGHKSERRRSKLPPPVAPTPPEPQQTARKRREAAAERDEHLETEVVPVAVADAERSCPHCDKALRPVGEGKPSTVYEYVHAHFRRRIFMRETLSCRCGHIVTAPAPERMGEKTCYARSFVAHLVVNKCADAGPQYRLEKAYRRLGFPISRSTMCSYFHRAADELKPLYSAALALVPKAADVHADETSIRQVGLSGKAYLWDFVTHDLVVFRYAPNRSGDTPKEVLGNSTGRLVVDQYTGYNAVTQPGKRTRAGCLAHARRKIYEQREHPETKQAPRRLVQAARH